MNEKQYRKKLMGQMKQAREAYVDSSMKQLRMTENVKATAKQMAAIEAVGEAPTRRSIESGLRAMSEATLFDEAQTTEARVAALSSADLPIGTNKAFTERLIRLIGDSSQAEALRVAAFNAFRGATFSLRKTASWRPTFLEVFRRVAETEANEVAGLILRLLAQDQDEWALARLAAGLRKPAEAIVPAVQAVQHLAPIDHGDHFDVLRKVAAKNRSRKVREEAIRALATDPASLDLLVGLVQNREEAVSIRQAALLSLRILSPEEHRRLANAILEDTNENAELRALCITSLDESSTPGYLDRVRKAKEEAPESAAIQKAAQMYLPEE